MTNEFKNIYFIGIGGIGMSALAQYFKYFGHQVAGYDLTPSKITENLEKMGISIHFNDDINFIPQNFLNKDQTLIVYTPAVPAEHKELVYFRQNNFKIYKRAQVLGFISENDKTVAVAGTHGKTTTSSFVTHILNQSDNLKAAFVGGIIKNYGSNFVINEKLNEGFIALEADEFDRSFLHLRPNIAVINSVDADHLDIYHDAESFTLAFVDFMNLVQDSIVINEKIELQTPKNVKSYRFGTSSTSEFCAKNVRQQKHKQVFDIAFPGGECKDISLYLPGKINIENATAAFAATFLAGVEPQEIKSGIESFKGVERRFDVVFHNESVVLINDYAHHPTEISGLAQAVSEFYPDSLTTAIFQPHLYSRTRDFADNFAKALEVFDQVILLPIYPARELPIEGVSSKIILDKIHNANKQICQKNELVSVLSKMKLEVVVTIGAGDIDNLVPQIREMLMKR